METILLSFEQPTFTGLNIGPSPQEISRLLNAHATRTKINRAYKTHSSNKLKIEALAKACIQGIKEKHQTILPLTKAPLSFNPSSLPAEL